MLAAFVLVDCKIHYYILFDFFKPHAGFGGCANHGEGVGCIYNFQNPNTTFFEARLS